MNSDDEGDRVTGGDHGDGGGHDGGGVVGHGGGTAPRTRPAALALMGEGTWTHQFDAPRRARLAALAHLPGPMWLERLPAPGDDPTLEEQLAEVQVLLTGWGTGRLDATALALMPQLHTVLHCAGSVRGIVTDDLWLRGVQVSTCADLNAEPVAEFAYAAVVMAARRAPFLAADPRVHLADPARRDRFGPIGTWGLTVGLVGFSRIGCRVAAAVTTRMPAVTCLVSDPYADPAEVAAVGAELVDLDDMLPRLDVLSLHAPALPSTHHLLDAARLRALPDHACVVNTARGTLIDTAALEAECASGRLTAVLDVTDPEPLPASSRLYDLPSVMVTPHIAGSLGAETLLMTDGALDELERVATGAPLQRRLSHEEFTRSA